MLRISLVRLVHREWLALSELDGSGAGEEALGAVLLVAQCVFSDAHVFSPLDASHDAEHGRCPPNELRG